MIGGEKVFTLKATPVADRSIAQLPDFGSRVGGRYRLLTIRDRATEEAIILEAGKRSADPLHLATVGTFESERGRRRSVSPVHQGVSKKERLTRRFPGARFRG